MTQPATGGGQQVQNAGSQQANIQHLRLEPKQFEGLQQQLRQNFGQGPANTPGIMSCMLVGRGWSPETTAEFLGYSTAQVQAWLQQYQQTGLAGVQGPTHQPVAGNKG